MTMTLGGVETSVWRLYNANLQVNFFVNMDQTVPLKIIKAWKGRPLHVVSRLQLMLYPWVAVSQHNGLIWSYAENIDRHWVISASGKTIVNVKCELHLKILTSPSSSSQLHQFRLRRLKWGEFLLS